MCINTTHQFSPNLNHCLSSSKIDLYGKYRTHRNPKRKKQRTQFLNLVVQSPHLDLLHTNSTIQKREKRNANDKRNAEIKCVFAEKTSLATEQEPHSSVWVYKKLTIGLHLTLTCLDRKNFLPRLTWLQTPLKSQVSNL